MSAPRRATGVRHLTDSLFYPIVFGAGLVAGVVNTLAGADSLITLPVLMFLGLPAALANGTNRLSILVQNVAAIEGFRRRGIWDLGTGVKLGLIAIPGALAGAFISIRIPDEWFRAILAGVLVVAVISLLGPGAKRDPAATARPRIGWAAVVAFTGIGFYGGFIQAGVGLIYLAVFNRMLHVNLVWANMYKMLVTGVFTVPAIFVFVAAGQMDWLTGTVLAIGSAVGAWIGTHVAVKGGEPVIRRFIAVALMLMAVRLVVGG